MQYDLLIKDGFRVFDARIFCFSCPQTPVPFRLAAHS